MAKVQIEQADVDALQTEARDARAAARRSNEDRAAAVQARQIAEDDKAEIIVAHEKLKAKHEAATADLESVRRQLAEALPDAPKFGGGPL